MKRQHKVVALSLFLGLVVWVIDTAVDYLLFYEGSFWDLLILHVPPHELYVRTVTLGLFLAFGLILSRSLARQQAADERLRHLNTVLAAVRNVNKLIVKLLPVERLIQQACELLVETRGYYSAWIVLVDEQGQLIEANGVGDCPNLTKLGELVAAGEVPECLREAMERPGVHLVSDAVCPLYRVEGQERAALATNLRHGDRIYGVLCVTLQPGFATDEEEQGLVVELASDVALALDNLAQEEERRRAEEALRRERDFSSAVMDTAPALIIVLDREGRIIRFNQACERVSGYSAEEIAGRRIGELGLAPEEEVEPAKAAWRPLQEGETPSQYEGYLVTREGERHLISWYNTVLLDAEGAVEYIVGIGLDITEHRQAEDAVRQERDRAQQYLDVAGVMIVALDAQGKVTLMNHWGCELLGYEAEEILGQDYFDLVIPEGMKEEVRSVFLSLLRGGIEPVEYYENPVMAKEGEERIVAWHNTVIRDEEGRITGILSSGTDITEHRLATQEATRSQRLAALGQLASGVAHEFNNLLFGMNLHAEIAERQDTPEDYEKLIEVVHTGKSRGCQIAGNLMTFAQPREPDKTIAPITVPLEGALALVERQFTVSGIEVVRDWEERQPVLELDTSQLEQVFLNIFLNAGEAMSAGGKLNISVGSVTDRLKGPSVEVRITDTGRGIRPEHVNRIFEPFFTTKGIAGGGMGPNTGLGLSISYGLVEANDGTIEAESKFGQGTTVIVQFPLSEEKPVTMAVPRLEAKEPKAPRPLRVLVVDDEVAVLEGVKKLLGDEGYEVSTAASGTEGLELARTEELDVVLCDLVMPDLSGGEVLVQLSQERPELPVIILTGRIGHELEKQLIAQGAAGVLRKPISGDDLREALRKVAE